MEVPDADLLDSLIEFEDCSAAGPGALRRSVSRDPGIAEWLPESKGQIDPRNGERILYSVARARRPHDTGRGNASPSAWSPPARFDPACPVCNGKTTSILDVADLSGGERTFINKNLFPIAFPFEPANGQPATVEWAGRKTRPRGFPADGCHYLQWTSSRHDRDWHNSSLSDLTVALERLAAFEETLLSGPGGGHVAIIKNFGRLVGGSLVHGHQQILHTNVLPRRIEEDRRFMDSHGQSFARFLLEENPGSLTIRDYGRVRLVTPWFLKRTLESIAIVTDTSKEHLHQLNRAELRDLARALRDATSTVIALMPSLGREVAYNLAFHTGPIGGLYVEMLPFSQWIGGYVQLGIFVCQGTPRTSHRMYRQHLGPLGR